MSEGAAHRPAPGARKKRIRPAPLSVRMTPAQRVAVKAAAAKAGLSVNRYLLLQACGNDPGVIKPSIEDRIERAGALRGFRGTGNLLNQIARHLNSGRIVGSLDIEALLKRHEEKAAAVLAAFIKGMPQ